METKMINKLITVFLFLIVGISSAIGQLPVKGQPIDMNGLNLYGQYTKVQVIAKLGQPTDYYSYKSDIDMIGEVYYYGKSEFIFNNNGWISEVHAEDNRFKFLGGYLSVGDNIEKLRKLGETNYGVLKYIRTLSGELVALNIIPTNGVYFLWIGDNYFSVAYQDNVIISISFYIPV